MPMKQHDSLLQRLGDIGVLRAFDVELGRCLLDLNSDADPALGLIAAATSLAVSQGHSCLPLERLPEVLAEACPEGISLPALPDASTLLAALHGSRWAEAAGDKAIAPLLYDDRTVWLGRYFHYEGGVARVLHRLLACAVKTHDSNTLRAPLQPFFTLDEDAPNWQAVAALTGLVSPLTVITGGPGTGKTTTVLWLLAALVEQARAAGRDLPRIALAAPTGKAAARLGESLAERLPQLAVDDAVRDAIPASASTLHRLLGSIRNSSRFRHHRRHPLDVDVVVVDEVSMVDLPLMAKLLDALPEHARLVLLGDRDQLASVEAGNVLAAICTAAGDGDVSPTRAALVRTVTGFTVDADKAATPFADVVVELRDSHRFGADSGLGRLAAAVRAGDTPAVIDGLHNARFTGVSLDAINIGDPAAAIVDRYGERFAALAEHNDPVLALRAASKLRVLTALRSGPSGCGAINAAMEVFLRRRAGVAEHATWYPGRLLLITENDYGSDLFNGDIGIVLADADAGKQLKAWFPAADGGVRSLSLSVLPPHEAACAMTIHKSQGSEFNEVAIVLPPEDARVLSRELLYTAVTRARERVVLLAGDTALTHALGRSSRRYSGLVEVLSRASEAR